MFNNSKCIVLISGIVSIIMTMLFFVMIFNDIFSVPMIWVSLISIIIAEIIGIIKAVAIKKTIFGISNIIMSFIHIVAVFFISIVFIKLFPFLVREYILLNILLLCVLCIVDVVILYFTNRVISMEGCGRNC